MNDEQIEREIQAKGLTAARVTPDDVEEAIASEHYFSAWDGVQGAFGCGNLYQRHADTDTAAGQPAPLGTPYEVLRNVTICALVLRNGHKIIGVNEGPVSHTNFDAALGRKLARTKATDQIWPLLGYALKERLAREAQQEGRNAAADA